MKRKIAVLGSGWAYEFISEVLEGIQEATADTSTDVYYFSCYRFHDPNKAINTTGYRSFDSIVYTDFDGIIVLANLIEDEDSLKRITKAIIESKVPAVALVRQIEGLSYIHINNYIGYYNLINHLLDEHNVKNIGFIGGIKDDAQSEERYAAFSTALKEHNIKENENLVIKNSDWSFKDGFEIGLKLFEQEQKPDAVICSNDILALGVIRAAYQNKLSIPNDIKILGFDNSAYSERLIPSISTVMTKPKEMGKKAIEIIFSDSKEIQNIEIPSEPVIRQSCGCEVPVSQVQYEHGIRTMLVHDEDERFSTHLRHTEDVFINDNNVHMFWESCQNFYVARHEFEGDNFAILLRTDLIDSILYQDMEFDDTKPCDTLHVFINIKDGEKQIPSVIRTRELFPPSMNSSENNLFVFIPLVYHKFLYGYYVSKNNMKLIINKRGYTWAKNFSNSIQKFREKTKYLLLSQKYLGLSTKDSLTGIYNRAALELFANDLYETNRHSDLYTIITFIDVNGLKTINDKHGHLHGDLAIKIIAEEIKNSIPDKWLPIRYGGDEFVVIGTSNYDTNINYVETLNEKLKLKQEEMSLPYELTVSIGSIAVPPDSTLPLETEINNADSIMYRNKQIYHETHDKK